MGLWYRGQKLTPELNPKGRSGEFSLPPPPARGDIYSSLPEPRVPLLLALLTLVTTAASGLILS